ncbi:hypothetical protein DL771_010607 [Monosporascus sp. 5C6A]|nr:hypothetical protein DL771_010607 [Monosporascus sp. 5C6A]
MYESFFSYPVERQYPYRWFTPAVIVGGIVIAALISFVNVIATGYELAATSSNNPNETMANPRWYGGINWPSFFTGNAQATCAASTFNLNAEVFTNNSAFSYTLQRVWRTKDDGTDVNLGSLVYLNNPLNDCNVTMVNIQVLGRYSRNIGLTAISRAGVLIEAYARCSIDVDTSLTDDVNGPTYFDLMATYDLVNSNVPRFLSRNETTQASLYWGESLLQMYWLVLARNYKLAANGTVRDDLYDATITLRRNSIAAVGTAAEVESLDFFHVSCFTERSFCGNSSLPQLMQGDGEFDPYPSIWKSVDVLGKAMWFSVLTDLGRNQSAVPNMLVEPTLLANLTSNYTSEIQAWPTYNDRITQSLDPSLAQASFDPNVTPLPDLNARQSTLTTNYVCQVPRMKSAGTLFYTVLQADLVYLQNAYMLFVFVVGYLLHRRHRKHPDTNYCDGCREVIVQRAQQPNDQHMLSTGEVGAALDDQDSSSSSTHNNREPKGYVHLNQNELRSP